MRAFPSHTSLIWAMGVHEPALPQGPITAATSNGTTSAPSNTTTVRFNDWQYNKYAYQIYPGQKLIRCPRSCDIRPPAALT